MEERRCPSSLTRSHSLTQPCDSCQMLVRQPDSCPTHEPGCTPVGSLTHTHTPARPTVLPSFRTLDPVVVRVAVDVHGVVRDLGFRPHTRRARAWSEPRREREGEGGAERVSFSRGKREARQGEAEGGRGRGRSRRNKGQGGVREVEARGVEREGRGSRREGGRKSRERSDLHASRRTAGGAGRGKHRGAALSRTNDASIGRGAPPPLSPARRPPPQPAIGFHS